MVNTHIFDLSHPLGLTKRMIFWYAVFVHLFLISTMLTATSTHANTQEAITLDASAGEGLNIVVSVPPLSTLVSNLAPGATISVLFETEQALHRGSISAHHLKLLRYASLVLSTPSPDEQNHLDNVMKKFKKTPWQVLTQPVPSDHGWLIPHNSASYVAQISDVLSKLKPRQQELFVQNSVPIIANLQQWESSFKSAIARVNTPIFSVHSVLGGFNTHYGLTVHVYEVHGHDPGPADYEIWLSRAQQMRPCCIVAPKSSAEVLGRKLSTQTGANLFLFEPLSADLEHTYQTLALLFKEVSSHGN